MEKPRPTINDANWRRVSRTLDFILSYPVKEVVRREPKPVEARLEPRLVQRALPLEGVVFEAGKV